MDFHQSLSELGFVAAPVPAGTGAPPSADQALQAAVVATVFRRMHGLGDSDTVRDAGTRGAIPPLQYHQFVRWAAPLDYRLYVWVQGWVRPS